MKKFIIISQIFILFFCGNSIAQSNNQVKKVTIIRLIFDDEETTTAARGSLSPQFKNNGGSVAGAHSGSYTGSETKKNKVAYVTFSDNVTKCYDVRQHPEWRTVEKGDLVEKNYGSYVPLHRKATK